MKIPFYPPSLSDDPSALTKLLGHLFRHTFQDRRVKQKHGWKGFTQNNGESENWVFQLQSQPGLYGIFQVENIINKHDITLEYHLYYFPQQDETRLEQMSLTALYCALQEDYQQKIRHFTRDLPFANQFLVGLFTLTLDRCADAMRMSLSYPEKIAIPSATASIPASVLIEGEYEALYQVNSIIDSFCQSLIQTLTHYLHLNVTAITESEQPLPCPNSFHSTPLNAITAPEWRHSVIYLESSRAIKASHETETNNRKEANNRTEKTVTTIEPTHHWLTLPTQNQRIFRPQLLVVSGFLGSGKTSFINQYIEFQNNLGQFVAVIQNEIGQQGLDQHLLIDDFAVVTMEEGCVCCSLAGSLEKAINQICQQFHPEIIILECSGVANPINVLNARQELEACVDISNVVTIIDGNLYPMIQSLSQVFVAQIELASTVLINHASELSASDYQSVYRSIIEINPRCHIEACDYGRVHPNLIREPNHPFIHTDGAPSTFSHQHQHSGFEGILDTTALNQSNHHDEHLMVYHIEPASHLCEAALKHHIQTFSGYVVRCKGYLAEHGEPCVVQYTANQYDSSLKTLNSQPFLMIAGFNLVPAELEVLGRVQQSSPRVKRTDTGLKSANRLLNPQSLSFNDLLYVEQKESSLLD